MSVTASLSVGSGSFQHLPRAHDYIEVFYNQRRRHSTLGQISPAEFETRAARGVDPVENGQERRFPPAPHHHLFRQKKNEEREPINLRQPSTDSDQAHVDNGRPCAPLALSKNTTFQSTTSIETIAFYERVFGAAPVKFHGGQEALFTERSFILSKVSAPALSELTSAMHHGVIHGNRMQVTRCGPITAVSTNTLRKRALSWG